MQTNVVAGEGYSVIQLIGKLDSDTAVKVDAVFTETMASQTNLLLDFGVSGFRIAFLINFPRGWRNGRRAGFRFQWSDP